MQPALPAPPAWQQLSWAVASWPCCCSRARQTRTSIVLILAASCSTPSARTVGSADGRHQRHRCVLQGHDDHTRWSTILSFRKQRGPDRQRHLHRRRQADDRALRAERLADSGWSNLDDPKQFYAFDGECPNCFSPDAIPVKSRPLTLSTSGMASCAVCHRQYNLNTGGNVASGDNGRKLNRYHASCAPDGTVSVIN